jgi:hypothetical protein
MTASIEVLQLSKDGAPRKRNTSVGELAKSLGVSFAASDLQLTTIKLARHVESLQFEVQLLRHELRRPLWRRLADRLTGSAER